MTKPSESIDITVQRARSYLSQLGFSHLAIAVPSRDRKSLVFIFSETMRERVWAALPKNTWNDYPVLRVVLPRLVP